MKNWIVLVLLAVCAQVWAADEKPVAVKLGGQTWTSAFQTDDLRIENGLMKATCLGFDPFIECKELAIDAGANKALAITMAISGGSDAKIYWTVQEGKKLSSVSENSAMAFTAIPDGRMRTYIVPVGQNSTWRGTVGMLRFDPCSQAMARFEIKSIEPVAGAKPAVAIWSDAPDAIVLTEGTTLPLSASAVNTGGTAQKQVSLSATADGAATAQASAEPAELAAGACGAEMAIELKAASVGNTTLTLKAVAEGGESRQIPVRVVAAQAAVPNAGSSLIGFDHAQGNSQWIARGERPQACADGDDRGIALEVDGDRCISFGSSLPAIEGLVLKAAGKGITAIIAVDSLDGKRHHLALGLGEKPVSVALPLAVRGGTLVGMDLIGSGRAELYELAVLSNAAPAAGVVLRGERFFRNEDLNVAGYIAEIRTPFWVEIPGSEADLSVELSPVELGEVGPIEGAPAPKKITAAGKGSAEVLIPDKTGICAYDLTVTGAALSKPYKTRLYAVEAGAELEKMRQPAGHAIYGEPQARGSETIPVFDYGSRIRSREASVPMALYQTDLSPAWLARINVPRASVFQGLFDQGLGQPSYLAIPTAEGVKVVKAEGAIKLQMSEPWVLAWFAGANGWNLWDVPTLIVLQRKPTAITANGDRLDFTFARPCGYLAYMPLYGTYRPPQQGKEVLSKQGLPERGVQSWTWANGLPQEVQERCRWWSRSLRKFPIDCEEKFNVDPASGSITVSQAFTYIDITDDWNTQPIMAAPVSPTLGFTQLSPGFPIRFEKPVKDLDVMTPYGPYMVVEDTDRYSYTVDHVVDYVNETEIQSPADTANPAVAKALNLQQQTMARRFAGGPRYMVEFDRKSFVWAQLAEHCFPKALAYADQDTQARMKGAYVNYYNNYFFGTPQHPADGERGWWRPELKDAPPKLKDWYQKNTICIDGPGIHGGLFSDSGKISASAIYNIWNYVHFTGDWNLAKRRWSFIRAGNTNTVNMDWKAMGRNTNAEGGEQMPPTMAWARLAYLAGDIDAYYYGVYTYMRECAMVFVKQRGVGGEYFRLRQPYGDGQPMPYWAVPSHTIGEAAGWMLDTQTPAGKYEPISPGEVQAQNRWVRFSSEDAARFYRENLKDQEIEELQALYNGEFQTHSKPVGEKASFAASQLRLWSYLTDASAEQLLKLFPAETWNWNTDQNGTILMAHAVIRSSYPRHYNRLVPRDMPASGFVTGLSRQPQQGAGWRGLTLFYGSPKKGTDWPNPRWFRRGKNSEPATRDNFFLGRLSPGATAPPKAVTAEQINWVTRVSVFE